MLQHNENDTNTEYVKRRKRKVYAEPYLENCNKSVCITTEEKGQQIPEDKTLEIRENTWVLY